MREQLKEDNYYHIYNRGNNSENIFYEKANYQFFLKKYGKCCYSVLDTYAYCLLKNHFHLLVRVRTEKEIGEIAGKQDEANSIAKTTKEWFLGLASQQLGHLFNSYTQAFNKRYGRTGSLFEKSFKRKKIDHQKYFCNLVSYIHRNSELHGFVKNFKKYPYSSYPLYFSDGATRLNREETLDRFGGIQNFRVVHDEGMKVPKEIIFK